MAFFEELGRKAKDVAAVAADKAKDMAAVAADKARETTEKTKSPWPSPVSSGRSRRTAA